jgi:hypothetical protein
MKSLNGLLFIIIGGAVIWIGATGRLPALAAALGMVRNAPGTGGKNPQVNSQFSDVTGGSSTTATGASSGMIGLTPKGQNIFDSAVGPYKQVLGLQ